MTSRARGIAGAAALIAILTVGSRVAGFARTVLFAGVVGPTDLGDVYQTANTIPNIIFEIVAGGALAALVVPLLAGAVVAGDREAVSRTASALLTWVLVLLVPLAVVVAVAAGPIVGLLGNDANPAALDMGARMLRVFAVQLPLYGVGIILAGVLQSHRRFAWPVLAPLLSSVTVMAAYGLFATLAPAPARVADIGRGPELVLSVGTTLGVAVLTMCLVVPVRRLRLRLRPTLGVDADLRRRAVGLAGAAMVTVVAQQLALAYLLTLANGARLDGTVVLFGLAQTVFLLPWAVLAVPVATSAYPELAEAAAAGERDRFDATLARTTRAVLLLAGLGAAALVAVAVPAARVLVTIMHRAVDPAGLAAGIAAFAPGLLGYALLALLSRALYAAGQARRAAVATAVGWVATMAAALGLSLALDPADRVAALAAANSIGMTVLGVALLAVVGRRVGRGGLAGVPRAAVAALVAGAVGAVAGAGAARAVAALTTPGVVADVSAGMLAGVVAAAGFLLVGLLVDRPDLGPMLGRLARALRRGRRRPVVDEPAATGRR
ncbi:lipid II flippase MurJ [Luedemannella helvata]|uniref:Peptidoglycan lipid II flippase n=1 Tax=Luedemannella helvata TaxID=349315 RepID=A0ABP4XAB0_9ACTN